MAAASAKNKGRASAKRTGFRERSERNEGFRIRPWHGLNPAAVMFTRSPFLLVPRLRYATALEKLQTHHENLDRLQRQTGKHNMKLADMQGDVGEQMEEARRKMDELNGTLEKSVSVGSRRSDKRGQVGVLKAQKILEDEIGVYRQERRWGAGSPRRGGGGGGGRRPLSMYELTCSHAAVSRPERAKVQKASGRSRLGSQSAVDLDTGRVRRVKTVSFSARK